jgi:hypothetical protein
METGTNNKKLDIIYYMSSLFLKPGFFLLALLCFLLPFQQFSCSNKTYLQVKGIDLAFGSKIDSSMIVSDSAVNNAKVITKGFQEMDSEGKTPDYLEVSPMVLASLICCALALIITLFIRKAGGSWLAAFLGLACIILLFIYYFTQLRQNNQPNILESTTRFLYGFWMIISFSTLGSLICILYALKKPKGINEFQTTKLSDIDIFESQDSASQDLTE